MKKELRYLHWDAPVPPEGLQPQRGVEYGCGDVFCGLVNGFGCYEPATPDTVEVRRLKEEDDE